MPESRQLEILSDLLRTAERNFEAAVKHAATIDDKAQKTSALAGIFLAVAFGFIKPESLTTLQQQYGPVSLYLLYLVLVLLVASIWLCLSAMWLRKVPVGGISVTAHEAVASLIFEITDDIDDELMVAYRENQIRIWKDAIAERNSSNIGKTSLVHNAQRVLATAIATAAITMGMLGFATRHSAIPSNQEKSMPDKQTPAAERNRKAGLNGSRPVHSGVSEPADLFIETREALQKLPPKDRRTMILKMLKDPGFIQCQIASLDRLE